MIQHVALFVWSPGFLDSPDMDEWARRLRGLPAQIDPLRSITIGNDLLHGERSWDTAVVAVLDDMDGLAEYSAHPAHDAVTAISAPHIDQLAQVDLEVV